MEQEPIKNNEFDRPDVRFPKSPEMPKKPSVVFDLSGEFPLQVRKKEDLEALDKIYISILVGKNLSQYNPLHFLFVACHEIGHGLADGPKKNWDKPYEKQIAVEGESDFFAVVCMQEYFSRFGLD